MRGRHVGPMADVPGRIGLPRVRRDRPPGDRRACSILPPQAASNVPSPHRQVVHWIFLLRHEDFMCEAADSRTMWKLSIRIGGHVRSERPVTFKRNQPSTWSGIRTIELSARQRCKASRRGPAKRLLYDDIFKGHCGYLQQKLTAASRSCWTRRLAV